MNRTNHVYGLLFVLLVWNAPYAYSQSPSLGGLDEYVEKSMKQWIVPGLAMAIVKDDRVVLAKGFGLKNINKPGRVDENTLFAIASNTKAFTATALGLLVQEGKISWDDPVTKYLPDFQLYDPVATRKIKIRDLLCHRSGLGTWAGDLTSYGSVYDRKEVMRRIRFQEPAFDFRTSFGYTNLMFLAAGEIIPAVTRTSWDDFIRKRFFQPLGMNRSNTNVTELAKMDNVASPHKAEGKNVVAIPYVSVDNHAPAGAINSCVKDIAQWLRLQLGDGKYQGRQLVDPAIIAETRKPHNLITLGDSAKTLNPSTHFFTYGLGWGLCDYQGRLVVRHTGGLDGMFSYVGFMPEEKLGVVVLTNMEDHSLMKALAYHVYDAYLEIGFQDWNGRYFKAFQEEKRKQQEKKQARTKARMLGTKPAYPLTEYGGVYESAVYGKVEIKYRNGELRMYLGAHPHITGIMKHWHHDTFLCVWKNSTWGESYIHFDFNDDSEIKQFRTKVRPEWIDTHEYTFIRK